MIRILLFIVVVNYKLNALLFCIRQLSVTVQQPSLVLIQIIMIYFFNNMVDIRVAHQIIHRGVEKIRQGDQGVNIGLNTVVFIFIHRLLADPNDIGKTLLAQPLSKPQFFQVF